MRSGKSPQTRNPIELYRNHYSFTRCNVLTMVHSYNDKMFYNHTNTMHLLLVNEPIKFLPYAYLLLALEENNLVIYMY